jgi:hypothetical protein
LRQATQLRNLSDEPNSMDGTAGHASATAASAASAAIIICVASQRGAFTQATGACSATHMSLQRGSTSYSSSAAVVQSIYQPVPVVVPLPRPNVGSGNAVVHGTRQGNVAPANGPHAERQIERRAACAGGFTDGVWMVHCLGCVIVLHS